MNLRQTFKENWDAAFIVVVFGLILGWALFVTCLSPLLGQGWKAETAKRTGEAITIEWGWEGSNSKLSGWNCYRSTATGSRTLVATGNPQARQFVLTMPGGSTAVYFYTVRPVAVGGSIGPGLEVIVIRKK